MASIYTCNKAVAERLKKYGLKPVQIQGPGYFFEIPKQALRLKIGKQPSCYFAGKATLKLPDGTLPLSKKNTFPKQTNVG